MTARLAHDSALTNELSVRTQGAGPTVVIVTGAGDCSDSWTPVADLASEFAPVVRYDRPGIGASPEGATPSVDGYLDQLDRVIDTVEDGQPIILVGHSLGGLIARLYADQFRAEVAGLVLVDPTPPQIADDRAAKAGFAAAMAMAHLLKMLTPLGVTAALMAVNRLPLYPEQRCLRRQLSGRDYEQWTASVRRSVARGAAAELASVATAAGQARTLSNNPELPVSIVASSAYGPRWTQWQEGLARQHLHSTYRSTGTKSHNIHLRHPDLVGEAIRGLVSRVFGDAPTEAKRQGLHQATSDAFLLA